MILADTAQFADNGIIGVALGIVVVIALALLSWQWVLSWGSEDAVELWNDGVRLIPHSEVESGLDQALSDEREKP